jgi:hypothetical protein
MSLVEPFILCGLCEHIRAWPQEKVDVNQDKDFHYHDFQPHSSGRDLACSAKRGCLLYTLLCMSLPSQRKDEILILFMCIVCSSKACPSWGWRVTWLLLMTLSIRKPSIHPSQLQHSTSYFLPFGAHSRSSLRVHL